MNGGCREQSRSALCPLPPADPPAADKDAYIDDIVPRHFENEARASGLPNGRALALLAELVDRLGPALARAREAVQDQVPDFVMDAISQDAMARAETVRVLLAADPG